MLYRCKKKVKMKKNPSIFICRFYIIAPHFPYISSVTLILSLRPFHTDFVESPYRKKLRQEKRWRFSSPTNRSPNSRKPSLYLIRMATVSHLNSFASRSPISLFFCVFMFDLFPPRSVYLFNAVDSSP